MSQSVEELLRRMSDRMVTIEEFWTHLERTVHDLDEVVQGVQDRVDGMERRLEKLSDRLRDLMGPEEGPLKDAPG